MNYLAHLSLAYPEDHLIAGNYIGDLITKKEEKELNALFIEGVLFHRWIDTFSNNSESLHEINKFLYPAVHKYAPVVSDIFCDFLLYKSWHQYFPISYQDFSNYNYSILKEYSQYMPLRVSRICQNMVEHKWLEQYQSLEGIHQVLLRTNKKLKFSVDLSTALPVLLENQEHFSELFIKFYDDCLRNKDTWTNLQNEGKL